MSREIDKIIAEKVFNNSCNVCEREWYNKKNNGCDGCNGGKKLVPKKYSTDIKAAFEVVESLKDFHPSLVWHVGREKWNVSFFSKDWSTEPSFDGSDKCVATAICKAALKALKH